MKPPKGAEQTLLDLADAAVAWWTMKRPIPWTIEQHIRYPTVNTVTKEEYSLARRAAEWCALMVKK